VPEIEKVISGTKADLYVQSDSGLLSYLEDSYAVNVAENMLPPALG
jgi:hypothetical protein